MGSGGIALCILEIRGERQASRPGRFSPEERTPAQIGYEAGRTPVTVQFALVSYKELLTKTSKFTRNKKKISKFLEIRIQKDKTDTRQFGSW
jgi:hypothetical protein